MKNSIEEFEGKAELQKKKTWAMEEKEVMKEIIQENSPELKSMNFQAEKTLWAQRMTNCPQ